MEENQESKVEEVPQQAESQEQETTSQPESTKPTEVKSEVEINWNQAQQALRMQKQQIEELQAELIRQQQQKPHEVDELDELDPGDAITVEQAKKLAEKKAKNAAREIVQEYMQEHTLQMDESRMRSKCDDYDYVIENFAAPLIKNDPALAHKVRMSKNPAETAYKLGKLADNYEEREVVKDNTKKAEKILKNSNRPVSGNALGSPLKGQADAVLKMTPQQVWEQSQKYARGA